MLVVGAGAAGLAAARACVDADPSLAVVVVEARGRLGGRAATAHRVAPPEDDDSSGGDGGSSAAPSAAGYPLELGAEFIHGGPARAVTWKYLARYSLHANAGSNRSEIWLARSGAVQLAEGQTLSTVKGVLWELETVAQAPASRVLKRLGPDEDTAAACLIPTAATTAGQFPATDEDETLLRNAAAEYFGADLDEVSLRSFADEEEEGAGSDGDEWVDADAEGGMSWRLEQGYSALWAAMAEGLDVRLHTAVVRIAHPSPKQLPTGTATEDNCSDKDEARMTVTARQVPSVAADEAAAAAAARHSGGETIFLAKHVICTLPLSILQSDQKRAVAAAAARSVDTTDAGTGRDEHQADTKWEDAPAFLFSPALMPSEQREAVLRLGVGHVPISLSHCHVATLSHCRCRPSSVSSCCAAAG